MKTDNWTGSATWQSKVLSQRSSSKRFPRPSHSPIVKSAKLLYWLSLLLLLGFIGNRNRKRYRFKLHEISIARTTSFGVDIMGIDIGN
jgi:hypothetical protein